MRFVEDGLQTGEEESPSLTSLRPSIAYELALQVRDKGNALSVQWEGTTATLETAKSTRIREVHLSMFVRQILGWKRTA